MRGHYGNNGVPRVGEMVCVDRSGPSMGTMLLGVLAIGGAVLYVRHQSKQIEKLSTASGVPYQSFVGSIGEGVKAFGGRVLNREGHQAGKAREMIK